MPIDDDSPKNLKRKRSADEHKGNETKAKIILSRMKFRAKKVTTVKIHARTCKIWISPV